MGNLIVRGIIGILIDLSVIAIDVVCMLNQLPLATGNKFKFVLAIVMVVLFLVSLVQDIRKLVFGIREEKELKGK